MDKYVKLLNKGKLQKQKEMMLINLQGKRKIRTGSFSRWFHKENLFLSK